MAFVQLTDYDGHTLVLNPAYIVSVTTARSSYNGNQANIRTNDGTTHSVRDSVASVYAKIEATQQEGHAC
ncbi:hypothetical protein [Achromobacter sp. Bel]|uniref:hypothetical protein n=1 Tax=Achromobacter sp. Bel TaxID=2727415 RepID=UPI00145D6B4C|nr:hypothetical protein [Achromobacter sp. Bel]NMK45551.1 hypothetical protein [Achromobacter sp. Bel]